MILNAFSANMLVDLPSTVTFTDIFAHEARNLLLAESDGESVRARTGCFLACRWVTGRRSVSLSWLPWQRSCSSAAVRPSKRRRQPRAGVSATARAAETAVATRAWCKIVDQAEIHLHHGNDDELRQPFERVQGEGLVAAVPGGNQDLSLIVRVNQADQIAQHDAVLVAEAGTRQDKRCQRWVGQVDGHAGRYEHRFSRAYLQWCGNARAQVDARRAARRVVWWCGAQARVE